ncbi:hypothetical protein EVJ58_g9538, partial [Rhodofomes roseus]
MRSARGSEGEKRWFACSVFTCRAQACIVPVISHAVLITGGADTPSLSTVSLYSHAEASPIFIRVHFGWGSGDWAPRHALNLPTHISHLLRNLLLAQSTILSQSTSSIVSTSTTSTSSSASSSSLSTGTASAGSLSRSGLSTCTIVITAVSSAAAVLLLLVLAIFLLYCARNRQFRTDYDSESIVFTSRLTRQISTPFIVVVPFEVVPSAASVSMYALPGSAMAAAFSRPGMTAGSAPRDDNTSSTSSVPTWFCNPYEGPRDYRDWSPARSVQALGFGGNCWSSMPVNWPSGGEIDTFEGVNQVTMDRMALHTGDGRMHLANVLQMSTLIDSTDCSTATNQNEGCMVTTPTKSSYMFTVILSRISRRKAMCDFPDVASLSSQQVRVVTGRDGLLRVRAGGSAGFT